MAFTWIAFMIQALFSSTFLNFFEGESVAILIVGITSLFFLVDLSRLNLPKIIFVALVLSYFFRLFLLFFDLFGREFYILPNSGYDSEMFHEAAMQGLATGDFGNGHLYSMVVGFLYTFFGNERMIAQLFNILLSMHAIVLVYKTMGLYKMDDQIKHVMVVIIALLPNYAILSSILLRESLIIFLYVLSFYCFSRWVTKNNLSLLILAYVFGLIVSAFHSGSIFLVMAYTMILFLYDRKKNTFDFNLQSVLIAVGFSIVFLFIYQNYFDLFFLKFSNLEEVGDVINVNVMGESGYSTGYPIGNPILNFIINTPIRVFYFVFSPLPWHWRGVTDIIAFIFSGLFYGYTLYASFQYVAKEYAPNKNYLIILLVIIVFGLIIFAWGVSNAGTALRHRDKFVGLFSLLLALTINAKDYRGETT